VHELSIASQIWSSVAKAASQHGASRVKAIKLEIGALNLIEEDQLTFWIQALAEREGSPRVEVKITTLPAGMQIKVVSAEVETGREPAEELPCERPG
jgi:Zn finger protein HypA/HybF involved in hydrogenase expression